MYLQDDNKMCTRYYGINSQIQNVETETNNRKNYNAKKYGKPKLKVGKNAYLFISINHIIFHKYF